MAHNRAVRNFVFVFVPFLAVACAASSNPSAGAVPLGDGGSGDVASTDDGGPTDIGLVADVAALEGSTGGGDGTSLIYASTDTALWSMDPTTKKVVKIGDFDFGAAPVQPITDVAVDKDGAVFVNSETTIFTVALPASGSGAVKLTKKLTLPGATKFYALGIATAGVLEAGEALVAGDSSGELYWIPTTGAAAQKLGTFGTWSSGDPPGGKAGDVWELSGDVVFFEVSGAPRGLATLRPCVPGGACVNGNDVVAEIDMTELAKKSPTGKLRKAFLGAGTGFGRLFGIGAWDDQVYGFSLHTKGATPTPAQLISIGPTGKGVLLQSFPSIIDGWTGAGVTTKAKVTIIK